MICNCKNIYMICTVFIGLLTASLFFLPVSAQAQTPTECPVVKEVPAWPVFRGLDNVGLYINIPGFYRVSIRCHGKESECASDSERDFPERRPEIISELKKNYSALPKALHPDQLASFFNSRLQERMMYFVNTDKWCKKPNVIILDEESKRTFVETPNSLTVYVKLDTFEQMSPRMGVLTILFYRPGEKYTKSEFSLRSPITIAIPLDLTDEEITALIKQYTRSSMLSVFTTEEFSQ